MPITKKDSILVLGAGASAQFSLPVGDDLLDIISEQLILESKVLENEIDVWGLSGAYDYALGKASFPSDIVYEKTPIYSTWIRENHSDDLSVNLDLVSEFIELTKVTISYMKNQTAETIDAFIAENPSASEITRIGISVIFFNRLYIKVGNFWELNNLSSRKLPKPFKSEFGERSWVHLLINLVRHGFLQENPTVTPDNPINIITFNYDTVLEKILEDNFSNIERELPHWTELIHIVHMHGKMPNLENEISDPFGYSYRMAQSIVVATEPNPPENVIIQRQKAKH